MAIMPVSEPEKKAEIKIRATSAMIVLSMMVCHRSIILVIILACSQEEGLPMSHCSPPYKSVAAALLFTLCFGPLGLFYASITGGVVMSALLVFVAGVAHSLKTSLPYVALWFFCCLWAMVSVNAFNAKLWKSLDEPL